MAQKPRARSLPAQFLLLAAAALLASSCHPRVSNPHDPKFIVAEKGDWTITRAELDKNVNGFLEQRHLTPAQVGPQRMPMLETKVVKDMVLEKLILARAAALQFKDLDKEEAAALQKLKEGFPTDKEYQAKLKETNITEADLKKRIHEQVLIDKTLHAEALKDSDPTEKEVNDFYLSHKNIFDVPLKLRASRVLVMVPEKATPAEKAAKKKKIDQARSRVAKGEDFSKVAMVVSEDRDSAPKGGDMGYFQQGENLPQFDAVAFASKVGVLSPVFESPEGYEFLKVTDIKPAGTLPIDDARAPIVQELRQQKSTTEVGTYTDKLLADSGVKYYIPLVDPPPTPPVPPPAAGGAPDGADGTAGTPVPLPPADSSSPAAPEPPAAPADATNAPAPAGP
jgi:parvulin-like peptidyl-prolyl isomerase